MSIDAMKQALEALELLARYENPETKIQVRKPRDGGSIVTMYPHKVASEAATALRAAIEQAEKHEPVAWMYVNTDGECEQIEYSKNEPMPDDPSVTPLYTAPRQWQGLTDEEIAEMHNEIKVRLMGTYKTEDIYRAIEAKLKEKNT